ncbi:MAG: hypothetical protein WDO73_23980 [Ignavibacteriota bacterium]
MLDPSSGFFGSGGNQSFEQLPQTVKIPQLRNLYDKIGKVRLGGGKLFERPG